VDKADHLPILTRSASISLEDKKFQDSFQLPNTEFKIAAYSGSYPRKIDRGKIFICPNFILFRPNTIFGTPEDVKIALADVTTMEKPTNHAHTLNLLTKDGKDHVFRAIIGRDGLADEIQKQYEKNGATLKVI